MGEGHGLPEVLEDQPKQDSNRESWTFLMGMSRHQALDNLNKNNNKFVGRRPFASAQGAVPSWCMVRGATHGGHSA